MLRSGLAIAISASLLFSLGFGSADAADSDGNFGLRGIGAATCISALEQIQQPDAALHGLSWLMGYMTAVNRGREDRFDVSPIVDGAVMMQLLANACAANPDLLVENAAHELLQALSVAGVRQQSDVVSLEWEGASTMIRRETLVAVQERLRDLELLEGAADGVFGGQTRAALANFQERNGLAQTQIPDPATLLALLIPDVVTSADTD